MKIKISEKVIIEIDDLLVPVICVFILVSIFVLSGCSSKPEYSPRVSPYNIECIDGKVWIVTEHERFIVRGDCQQ